MKPIPKRSSAAPSPQRPHGPVVVVHGELDLGTAPALEVVLDDALDLTQASVWVDLAGVEFIDSTGIHVLLRARTQAHGKGIDLAIHAPTTAVTRVLDLLGLTDTLTTDTDGIATPAMQPTDDGRSDAADRTDAR